MHLGLMRWYSVTTALQFSMFLKQVLTLLLLISSGLATAQPISAQQSGFQAQHGWGLPRLIGESDLTQGIVIDAAGKRAITPTLPGLQSIDLETGTTKALIQQIGIRDLRGVGSGSSLALAWFNRSLTDPNGIWWWFKGQAKLLLKSTPTDFALLEWRDQPLIVFVANEGEWSVVYAQAWNRARLEVYRTKLNIGALSAALNFNNELGVLFAEGFRTSQAEKYDAKLITAQFKPDNLEQTRAQMLGPAVYTGRGQRYALGVIGSSFYPVWWFETVKEQQMASVTRRHFPRLAVRKSGQTLQFDRAGQPLGQLGNELYYRIKHRVYSVDISAPSITPRLQLVAPDQFGTAFLRRDENLNIIAWQSYKPDGFSSSIWLADSSAPYQPTLLDHVSVAMGWNPWFPWQNALGQSAFSMLLAALAGMITVPLMWLIGARINPKSGVIIGFVAAWMFVIIARIWSGAIRPPEGWALTPLLAPQWWVVVVALGLGSLIAWGLRKHYQKTELSAVIASSLIVMVTVFIAMFSTIGFLDL